MYGDGGSSTLFLWYEGLKNDVYIYLTGYVYSNIVAASTIN